MELKLLKNKSIIKIILIFILTSFNILKAFSQEEEVGKIDNIIGKAEVFKGKETVELKKGDLVHPSDTIRTKENALVKIIFFDGADIILYENSELNIKEYKVDLESDQKSLKSIFENIKGKIRFFVKPDKNINNDVKYKTSNAVMGVRGTGGFIVAPENATETQLVVTTGKVELSNPSTPEVVQEVKENQWGKIEGDKPPPPPEPVTPELIAALKVTLPEGFDNPQPAVDEEKEEENESKSSTPDPIVPVEGKNEESEYFRIGPMASFGFFQFFSIGAEARLFHFLGISASYGGISNFNLKNYPSLEDRINHNNNNTPIQDTSGNIQHLEGRVVIYPFFGSLFIGTAFGFRHLQATVDGCEYISQFGNDNSCVPLRAHLTVDTVYFAPQIGWMAVFDNGFTLGTELGVQIPVTSGNENFWSEILTTDQKQYSLVANSYAYQDFQRQIRDNFGDYFRSKTLPFWNIIKIGWMF
ncbi:hypothetical protein GCL60_11030 [Silvanigrella paludirubra]|uniref:FecR protein domain-containing protein n=1 Tax=Silvanigrella paludirubra TaxID=2499159 RepID=A0A6N6VQL6_9BACT|nr:hypothetical protein GCL60_11030 [Silvanigrella paludirubra]